MRGIGVILKILTKILHKQMSTEFKPKRVLTTPKLPKRVVMSNMSTEEEIERLDSRVTRLDQNFFNEVKSINTRLTELMVSMAQRRDCPTPGLCLTIQTEMTKMSLRLEDHSKRIQGLEKWQYAMIVLFSLLMTLLTLFGPYLRDILKIPM